MLSRFIATTLLSLTPLLLACGTNSTANLVVGEEETTLSLCEHEDMLTIPDCDELIEQLEVGETVIVKDGLFNYDLAENLSHWELDEWRDVSNDGFIVNQISPGPEPEQWVIEVWLQQDGELVPIETVFPRFSEAFWMILEYSLYGQLLDYDATFLAESERIPINWDDMDEHYRKALESSPERQILLELFDGNRVVLSGALDFIPTPPRRGCSDGLEAVFGEPQINEQPNEQPIQDQDNP
ncbi:MAG: hypothetical protein F6J87_25245 [Spirulina sp. SIO3F2]|nr:hypothetical protein [Spirulina sp. SIO3F2]